MRRDPSPAEAGFSLVEVVLASALFAFVALAGFELLRQLGGSAAFLAGRADAVARLESAAAELRSDALSATAVWKPASACGDALEFMQRDAGGTSFVLYVVRAATLSRAVAPGPLDPCDPALQLQALVPAVAGFTVNAFPAGSLAAHVDPVSGNPDGGLLAGGGITAVAAAVHATDAAGAPIIGGNTVIEVRIDADPRVAIVDLVAGNRPSGYTGVLTYTCNGRCEATTPFPEARGARLTDCLPGYDFAASPAYYVAASVGYVPAGNGRERIVITSYNVTGGYTFAFAGPVPRAAERVWPVAVWPPAGSPLAGTIADSYPLDYTNNSVAGRGAALVAADLGEPAAFAAELTACADMHADPTFDG